MVVEITAIWLCVVAALGVSRGKLIWDLNRLKKKFDKGDLESFDEGMDRLLRRTRNPSLVAFLRVSKAAGLLYLGRWSESLLLLESVSAEEFKSKQLSPFYLNNLLYTLLLCKEYDKARRLFIENENLIVPESGRMEVDTAIIGTLATYRYYFNGPDESRRLLERLLETKRGPLPDASILYFLGRLDLQSGNVELGWQRIEKSALLAPQAYFSKEVSDLKAGHPRIGLPGEGSESKYSSHTGL